MLLCFQHCSCHKPKTQHEEGSLRASQSQLESKVFELTALGEEGLVKKETELRARELFLSLERLFS